MSSTNANVECHETILQKGPFAKEINHQCRQKGSEQSVQLALTHLSLAACFMTQYMKYNKK